MAVSTRFSRSGVCFLLGVLWVAGAQTAGCSAPFHSCYETRTCPPEDQAGAAGDESYSEAGGRGGNNGGRSGNAAGHTGVGGQGATIADGGSSGAEPDAANAGAAGSAGAAGTTDDGSDLCGGKACTGDTPKCKASAANSECVACLTGADCSNGGTCNGANECVCSNRFNGKRCEFQVFRRLGTLRGDFSSAAYNISHDGRVVIGISSPQDGSAVNVFRSANEGEPQFIPNPTNSTGCSPSAVDSAGNVIVVCDKGVFLNSPAGVTTAVPLPMGAFASDISMDGKVIVGMNGSQAFRWVNSVSSSFGPLQPNTKSWLLATNGDGSVAVGANSASPGFYAVRWTMSNGLTPLPSPTSWVYSKATDISTDGKVIVGWASLESDILSGQVAVKWSGASPTGVALSPTSPIQVAAAATAVNADGSVIVGRQGLPSVAMLWDSAGAHIIQSLLGSTSDLTSDWTINEATGVSDDGKFVVGVGTYSSHYEAWIVHLP